MEAGSAPEPLSRGAVRVSVGRPPQWRAVGPPGAPPGRRCARGPSLCTRLRSPHSREMGPRDLGRNTVHGEVGDARGEGEGRHTTKTEKPGLWEGAKVPSGHVGPSGEGAGWVSTPRVRPGPREEEQASQSLRTRVRLSSQSRGGTILSFGASVPHRRQNRVAWDAICHRRRELHPPPAQPQQRRAQEAVIQGSGWQDVGSPLEGIALSLGSSRHTLPHWTRLPPGKPGAPSLPPRAVSGSTWTDCLQDVPGWKVRAIAKAG